MSDRGFRGYISSRPILGQRTPQHVQNLVIRDFAARHGLAYRLSAAEYAMPHCYLMLEQVIGELAHLDGMIAYSLFMMPRNRVRRRQIWQRVLDQGKVFHAAVEELPVSGPAEIERVETLFELEHATVNGGLSGRDLEYLRAGLRKT